MFSDNFFPQNFLLMVDPDRLDDELSKMSNEDLDSEDSETVKKANRFSSLLSAL